MANEVVLDPEDELLHYISYTQSAANMYATTEARIRSRSIDKLIFPDDCTSFELYDMIVRHRGKDTVVISNEIINRSQYYIGQAYDLATLARELGADAEIIDICRDIGSKRAVKVYGNEYIPLRDTDHVVSPERISTRSHVENQSGMERL